MNSIRFFSISKLVSFAALVFENCGFSKEDALCSAQLLVRADLRGIDSHGVARLSGYVRLVELGRLNPKPNISFSTKFPTQAHMDGDGGIGFLCSKIAMEKAMDMALKYGVGMVAVKNSNHFGIAGQYALMAAEKGLIGMAMTNASPLVAPTFSKSRMLGTNPISVAIPTLKSKPFVLDMATTTAANGKLEMLQRKNEPAPKGWIQSSLGQDSQNPNELKSGGSLKPLGSFPELGSHKGYGLGAWVDIFSGVLSGANFGPWVPPFVAFLPLSKSLVGEGIGHFFMAFRPDGFLDQEEFLSRMETWIEAFRSAENLGQEPVLIPGDPEWKIEEERMNTGVPLIEAVVNDLNQLGEKFNLGLFS